MRSTSAKTLGEYAPKVRRHGARHRVYPRLAVTPAASEVKAMRELGCLCGYGTAGGGRERTSGNRLVESSLQADARQSLETGQTTRVCGRG